MNYWLLKTEPDTFSWTQQKAQGKRGGIWDGVRNHQAANYLRAMAKGDQAFFYHTGNERSIVGIAEITRTAFPDPTDETGKFVSVGTRALEPLARPVTLAELKAEPGLKDFLLVRHPRLSVMPVSGPHWQRVLEISRT
jgi:predicted RNA-binding protein with PUA-like domain